MPAEARFEQVENLLADGRYDEAEPYILAMQKIKDDYQPITYLGDVALGRGDRAQALRLWDAAVEKSPDAWQAWCGRADRIKKLGMWDQAEADYEKCFAMQAPPRITDGLYSLAQMHEQKKDYAAAIRDYTRILEVNEQDYGDDTAETDRLKAEIARLRRLAEKEM